MLKKSKAEDGSHQNISIPTPQQWPPIIKMTKKSGSPYFVIEVKTEDIRDIKLLEKEMAPKFNKNDNQEAVLWTSIKILRINQGEPVLYYKTDYSDTEFKTINIGPKTTRGRPSKSTVELKPAYEEPPKIPPPKMKDLMDLCRSNVIPGSYHDFYHNLAS